MMAFGVVPGFAPYCSKFNPESMTDHLEQQTETLKLLFALYFRVLKNPRPSPLLPAALTGIAKFAHLVNIDFFRDLMKVLKDLISLEAEDMSDAEEAVESVKDLKYTRHRLQCIVTAFDLLSGQGENLPR